ncbi:hypothetical protein ACJX0J_018574, partial [Zea mays]
SLMQMEILSEVDEVIMFNFVLIITLQSCGYVPPGVTAIRKKEYVIVEGAHLSLNFVIHISQVMNNKGGSSFILHYRSLPIMPPLKQTGALYSIMPPKDVLQSASLVFDSSSNNKGGKDKLILMH